MAHQTEGYHQLGINGEYQRLANLGKIEIPIIQRHLAGNFPLGALMRNLGWHLHWLGDTVNREPARGDIGGPRLFPAGEME